jgi:hypothetical protein
MSKFYYKSNAQKRPKTPKTDVLGAFGGVWGRFMGVLGRLMRVPHQLFDMT